MHCEDWRCLTRACTGCNLGIHSMCKATIECWHTGRPHPCRCEGPGGGEPQERKPNGSEAARGAVSAPSSPPCGIRHPKNRQEARR